MARALTRSVALIDVFDGIVIVVEISTVDRSASDSCGAAAEVSFIVSEFEVLDSDSVRV